MAKAPSNQNKSSWPLMSMTGLGRAHDNEGHITIEIVARSVNSRGLDVKCRMPHELTLLEPMVYKLTSARFDRGRIDVDVKPTTMSSASASLAVDDDAAQHAYTKLAAMQKRFGITTPIAIRDVLLMPGVLRVMDAPPFEESTELAERVMMAALDDLAHARRREGALLAQVLQQMHGQTTTLIAEIAAMASTDVHARFRRFKERLHEVQAQFSYQEDRLHQEFALLVERSDFTEEIDRLDAHARHFADLCQNHDVVGRKLDFLCQEMLREVNTLLSKVFDGHITIKAIDLKAVIERIREQVQNIE